MRATLSLFQVVLIGAGAFVFATAALVVAMSIAITGPPTASELESLDAVLAKAGRDLGVLAERLGDEACLQLPPEATEGLCPAVAIADSTHGPSDEAGISAELATPAPYEEVRAVLAEENDAPREDLLGGLDDPVEAPRAGAEPRRAIARAPRSRAPPTAPRRPAPPLAVTAERAPRLAEADDAQALVEPAPPATPALRRQRAEPPRETWPTQWQAMPAAPDPYAEEDWYDAAPYPDEYDEVRAYEEARERRRRFRERIRRERAARDWERGYGW